jgi:Zn-finger nucleic acid-binding protein
MTFNNKKAYASLVKKYCPECIDKWAAYGLVNYGKKYVEEFDDFCPKCKGIKSMLDSVVLNQLIMAELITKVFDKKENTQKV